MKPIKIARMHNASAAPFMLADSTVDGGRQGHGNDFWQGYVIQAPSSGTLNNLVVKGDTTNNYSVNYRLVIYAANSLTDISGAKLGETAAQSSLLIGETKVVPLLAPVSIVSGNYYALGIQPQGTMFTARRVNSGGRLFADTYADGALGTAPTSGNNGGSPAIWGTS